MFLVSGSKRVVFSLLRCAVILPLGWNAIPAFADEIQGIASYYDAGLERYRAALYVWRSTPVMAEADAIASSTAMAFKIYRTRISSKAWLRDLSQRVAINNDTEAVNAVASAFEELGFLVSGPLKAGDLIVITRKQNGVSVSVNGIELGAVVGKSFFELLVNAWLGDVPPSSEFKSAILTEPPSESHIIRFEQISEIDARSSRINKWIAARAQLLEQEQITQEQIKSTDLIQLSADSELGLDEATDSDGNKFTLVSETEAIVSGRVVPIEANASALDQIESVESSIEAENPATRVRGDIEQSEEERLIRSKTNNTAVGEFSETKPARAVVDSGSDSESVVTSRPEKPTENVSQNRGDEKLKPIGFIADYRSNLQRHPAKFVRYPMRSQAKKEQGVVNLLVTIARNGYVVDVELESSSSFSRLDKAAVQAVRKASPFPALPDQIPGERLEFLLPLAFRLEN